MGLARSVRRGDLHAGHWAARVPGEHGPQIVLDLAGGEMRRNPAFVRFAWRSRTPPLPLVEEPPVGTQATRMRAQCRLIVSGVPAYQASSTRPSANGRMAGCPKLHLPMSSQYCLKSMFSRPCVIAACSSWV